jgi:hypothetical protein
MIIVYLYGGLGNQLFQYSLGRALSLRHDTDLFTDLSFFEQGKCQHPLSLVHFNVTFNKATQKEFDLVNKKGLPYLLWKLHNQYQKVLPYYKKTYVRPKYSHFDKNILRVKDNSILDGYWQSQKYFEEYTEVILKDLQLKEAPENPNFHEIKSLIRDHPSVIIHARRGDYLTLGVPLCGADYYEKAMKYIGERIPDPHYVVFSDDIEWCRENIRSKNRMTFIERSLGLHDYESMVLMSHAMHHIIANSTFGWWGAWLNPRKDKIVIYPEVTRKTLNKDLMPEHWICL